MRIASLIALALLLAGCGLGQYTADLSFARAPGLGYRNAGLFTVGTLYLFDQKAAKLTQLSSGIPLTKIASDDPPTTLTSSSVTGISISGSFGTPAEQVAADVSVGSKISFIAQNALRQRYQSVYTGLSTAYRDGIAQGEDMASQWFVDQVRKPGSGLYYVVINSIVSADKTSFSVGGMQSDDVAEISISVPGMLQPIKVAITDSRLAACTGAEAPCFFDVAVVKAYVNADKNLAFRAAPDADLGRLSEAFRKL